MEFQGDPGAAWRLSGRGGGMVVDERALLDATRQSRQSVAVYDMSAPGILATSDSARAQMGFTDVEPESVDIVASAIDPDRVRQVVELIRDGQLREWTWRSWLYGPTGEGYWDNATGIALETAGSRRLGLVFYPPVAEPCGSPPGSCTCQGSRYSIAGPALDELVETVRHGGVHTTPPTGHADGAWPTARVTVELATRPTQSVGPVVAPGHLFTDHTGADRIAQLEGHLHWIAREIEATKLAGFEVQAPRSLVGTSRPEFSERQRDIIARLLRGERVPTIARSLYLSPSTVRNHLSGIYRKMGVGSQAELIAALIER
jgi:DNA-binding CsgD family transcriptional regulator